MWDLVHKEIPSQFAQETTESSMAKDKATDRIRKLKDEINNLQGSAKEELLAEIRSGISELNELGFSYELTGGGRSWGKRARNPDRPCPVCNFVTDPPHDARAHRGQGKAKKAFTAAELKENGYSRKG